MHKTLGSVCKALASCMHLAGVLALYDSNSGKRLLQWRAGKINQNSDPIYPQLRKCKLTLGECSLNSCGYFLLVFDFHVVTPLRHKCWQHVQN